jgi:50S ribosomal protein L16 3-hydroxylase
MDITQPLALLGAMTPQTFMKRHWQKKPLLIRGAVPGFKTPGFKPLLDRSALFDLAASEDVESRLVVQQEGAQKWRMKTGPFQRRALPALKQPNWTLLVQGVDLHHNAVHALMSQFRFVPDARLDDLMISYATPGGGVGPHFDSYDVFLLQAHGRREWRIGRQKDLTLQTGVPLKILANFEPEQTFVLEPGDMLYLPPRYAHDGIALDECMTYSIGFRAPNRGELARELLQRLADDAPDEVGTALYQDATQAAVSTPGEIPPALLDFARDALQRALQDPAVLQRALGEYLTEPKSSVWFDGGAQADEDVNESVKGGGNEGNGYANAGSLQLDRRTKMMFDKQHIFINGEGFLARGRDATLMRQLADQRGLDARDVARASEGARALLDDWIDAGWVHEL